MTGELSTARESIQHASDETDQATVREQLKSINEGLVELTDGEGAQGSVPDGDRLEEVEEQIVELMDRTDGQTHARLENARDAIDAYRREYTRDW